LDIRLLAFVAFEFFPLKKNIGDLNYFLKQILINLHNKNMNDFDIPIFKKSYDLYKTFNEYRKLVPKQDRFTVFERSECAILDVLESIMQASGEQKKEKLPTLERASLKLNMLRVFIRLMKDTKAIDAKKYMILESVVDEIGRMLGGWIRSVKAE
jgi:hypothetical protein